MNDNELVLLIGRLEGKVDALLMSVHRQDERLGKAEERIGVLERGKAYLLGFAAALSAVFAALTNYLMEKIQ